MPKIFVSYRRDDSAQVTGRLYDKLVGCYGSDNVFKDIDSIPLGSDFRRVLEESLIGCDTLVAVIGRHWLNAADKAGRRRLEDPSDFVRLELEGALRRKMQIIPLLVDGAMMPAAEDLPTSLRDFTFRSATAIRPDPDFHRDMQRVIEALGTVPPDLGKKPTQHKPPLSPLKYYLYVSRTKVEMLYAQLCPEQHRTNLDDDKYHRLDAVVRRLSHDGLIGTCDQPLAYVRGTLDMHFGDVSFYRGGGRMVLFSGMTEKETLVGLVGSTAHVVGAPAMDSESLGYARPEFWMAIIESITPPSPDSFGTQMYDLDNLIDYQARRRGDAPKQRVEFVAKTFLTLEGLLIGSPLFVAAAE